MFNQILRAATLHLCTEITRTLREPLISTGLRPHYWLTADKATPRRRTVQCIILIAVHKGKKTVFPVGAPQVYSQAETVADLTAKDHIPQGDQLLEECIEVGEEEELSTIFDTSASDDESNAPSNVNSPVVEGGTSKDLVKNIIDVLSERLSLTSVDLLLLTGNI